MAELREAIRTLDRAINDGSQDNRFSALLEVLKAIDQRIIDIESRLPPPTSVKV
jgi:hypothetical protein